MTDPVESCGRLARSARVLIRVTLIVVLVASIVPVAQPGQLLARAPGSRDLLEQRFRAWVEDSSPTNRLGFLGALDVLAQEALDADPDASQEAFARTLLLVPYAAATVIDLVDDVRGVLWDGFEERVWGGGARLTLFRRDGTVWRRLGHVDSEDDTSAVMLARVDRRAGIVVLVESFQGNGAPPERAVAITVAGDRVLTATTGDVARVDFEHDRALPEIVVWRRLDGINPYSNEPLHAASLEIRREGDALITEEHSLTPWIDVVAAFCTGAHPELASASVRKLVERCEGAIDDVAWISDREVEIELPLALECGDVEDGTLSIVRRDDDIWFVEAAGSCW